MTRNNFKSDLHAVHLHAVRTTRVARVAWSVWGRDSSPSVAKKRTECLTVVDPHVRRNVIVSEIKQLRAGAITQTVGFYVFGIFYIKKMFAVARTLRTFYT